MTLEKKILNQYLKNAKVLCGKNALSALRNTVIWGDSKVIHLSCTNLSTWLFADIPFIDAGGFNIENFSMTDTLYSTEALNVAVRVMKRKYIEITVKNNELYFDETRITKSEIPFDNYPSLDFPKNKITGVGKINNFPALIEAQKFVSSDETRYFMNGVYFECSPNSITLVATDGRTLFKSDTDFGQYEGIVEDQNTFIIKDFSKHFNLELKNFKTGEHGIKFNDEVFKLFVLYIEGQFPNYNRVIPDKEAYHEWKFDLLELKSHIDKLTIECRMQEHRKDSDLFVIIANNKIRVTSDSTGKSAFIGESISFENNIPEEYTIGFNLEYFKKMIDKPKDSKFWISTEELNKKAFMVDDLEMNVLEIFMPIHMEQ